tara:strand:- start:1142 stop:1705 length:564 start_codon:yes stop_codon:yes gene_type:complete
MKICITGSLASGKSTVLKSLSKNKYPAFSADKIVSKLYKNNSFRQTLIRDLKISKKANFKKQVKKFILVNKKNLKKLEMIIHPLVREKMIKFSKSNKKKKLVFFEIPLLAESKLKNFFDITILILAPKNSRLRRYLKRGGNKKIFNLLDSRQLSDKEKKRKCDYLIVNNKTLSNLKNRANNIISKYE